MGALFGENSGPLDDATTMDDTCDMDDACAKAPELTSQGGQVSLPGLDDK
jgi:hypothetical protein